MKLQSEIIQSDKLICSEKVLFNKIELNAKINTAIKTMAKDNLRSSIATILSEANVNGRLEIQKQFEKLPFESARTIATYSFLKDSLITAIGLFSCIYYFLPKKPTKKETKNKV